jgi:hypothetical protein
LEGFSVWWVRRYSSPKLAERAGHKSLLRRAWKSITGHGAKTIYQVIFNALSCFSPKQVEEATLEPSKVRRACLPPTGHDEPLVDILNKAKTVEEEKKELCETDACQTNTKSDACSKQ